ncbi:hypothetical protein EYC80_005425 [Monilinia laxa]|uniref:DUF1996 domain-containing protein n=1 Tax=Monilinia laxa TaxID=61186 RepID=A0A5N6KJW7_MONLA|nr:hypothetical protein EYC80_005425 [Monilinia laxa]
MRGNSLIEKATILAGLASSVDAFWRLPCRGRTGIARIDPLVNPGTAGLHAHSIHGSSGFGESSGSDELLAGNCTSCSVAQDKSAYWTPSIYFKNAATGKFELVEQVGGMLAYYLLYGDNIQAFPKGFSMIAGNNDLRNFSNYPVPDIDKSNWNVAPYNTQDFLRQAALGFNCLNYAATPEASLYRHFLPDKAYLDAHCADGVRFELMFPSCWNKAAGVAPPDSRSHMAYPSTVMSGDCPEGFDTRLPSLFYETIWNTAAYKGIDGEFVISNGDPTGYGYHGDFIMGWDVDFLQSAVDTCTNLSGRIEDCPLFDIQDESAWGTCSIEIPDNVKGDDVTGPMDALPGDNPIQSGPGLATTGPIPINTGKASSTKSSSTSPKASSKATPTSAVVPTLSYSAGSSIAATAGAYAQGGVFAAVGSGSYSPSTTSTPAGYGTPTPAAPATTLVTTPAPPAFFSTSYSTTTKHSYLNEEVEVDEVYWVEDVVTVHGAARRRHVHQHQKAKKRGGQFA